MTDFSIDQTVEIKARCPDHGRVRQVLAEYGADAGGILDQRDTYYHAGSGRLKLRRSGSESYLIGYRRPDTAGPKNCRVDLCPVPDPEALDRALRSSLGVRIEVIKSRELYTLDNIRFHLDRVECLGDFVEIEVLGHRGTDPVESLRETCELWLGRLGIQPAQLVERAYADLLEELTPRIQVTPRRSDPD